MRRWRRRSDEMKCGGNGRQGLSSGMPPAKPSLLHLTSVFLGLGVVSFVALRCGSCERRCTSRQQAWVIRMRSATQPSDIDGSGGLPLRHRRRCCSRCDVCFRHIQVVAILAFRWCWARPGTSIDTSRPTSSPSPLSSKQTLKRGWQRGRRATPLAELDHPRISLPLAMRCPV